MVKLRSTDSNTCKGKITVPFRQAMGHCKFQVDNSILTVYLSTLKKLKKESTEVNAKSTSLNASVLHISVFQDRADRVAKICPML